MNLLPRLFARTVITSGLVFALIAVGSIAPRSAQADTYPSVAVYSLGPGGECPGAVQLGQTLSSYAQLAELCVQNYQTLLPPQVSVCTWWWYETGTQTWPSNKLSATLWVSTTPDCTSGGNLAYATETPGQCLFAGSPSQSNCQNAAPCGLGQTRNTDGSCPAKQLQLCPCVSEPIQAALANKFEVETDFDGAGTLLKFIRTYNSVATRISTLGPQWRHTYDRSLVSMVSGSSSYMAAYREDGRIILFSPSGSSWIPDPDVYDVLTATTNSHGNQSGWTYTVAADQSVETYDIGGMLLSITSRTGVTLSLTYGGGSNPYPASAPACNPKSGWNTGPPGLLACATDSFGHQLNFGYTSSANSANLAAMTDPAGNLYTFAYTGANLWTVTYPDSAVRTYVYNEPANTGNNNLPYALTGVVDENTARYSTFQYNSLGQPIAAWLGTGSNVVESYGFSYGSGQTTITDPLTVQRVYSFSTILGVPRSTSVSQTCVVDCGGVAAATTYDTNGNVTSRKDYNGNLTCYQSDPTYGLELYRGEGFAPGSSCPANLATYTPQPGTLQRIIATTWNDTFRVPLQIVEPNRTTNFTYDSYGNVKTKGITDTSPSNEGTRTWKYMYYSNNGLSGLYGQVYTLTGPRTDITTDVTTYVYYPCTTGSQCGQLNSVTSADTTNAPTGLLTTYNSYNGNGQPLQITDPNGVMTTLTYDLRGRLLSSEVGTETTAYSYYPTGLLQTVKRPDASTLTYAYDQAHRLTTITDGAGNYVSYTLDTIGNHHIDHTYDPMNALHFTHTRNFNSLGLLYQDVNAAGTPAVTTTYYYDSNNNLTSIDAPLGRNTSLNPYDALNRLTQITDPNGGITTLGYDANDNLNTVEDPRYTSGPSFKTTYTHVGFDEVTMLASSDTGTSTTTPDSAGNVSKTTDARGSTANYSYDALNRVTQIIYKNSAGVSDQTILFGYDTGTNGKGRLASASDANHSMTWSYDTNGRVTSKGQTVTSISVTKTVNYNYINGDLTSLVTPSGQTINYGYVNHRVSWITVNGTTLLNTGNLVNGTTQNNGLAYEPFGPVNAWTWGDSRTVNRNFNGDGLISTIVTPGATLGYSFDYANRITGISDSSNSALTWGYGYDPLDRLTSANTSVNTYGWPNYDANGNRTAQTTTNPTTFSVSPSSNQLANTTGTLVRTYAYDAAGNTQGYGSFTFSYNNRGRMSASSANSTNYLYNALGQMIEKSGSAGTTIFMQDESGHLIGEYNGAGNLIEETIWLDDIPVATLRPNVSGGINIFYIYTDHLGTPKNVAQPVSGTLAWRWDTDPFGTATPNQNPGGLGTFVYNLRFPGQYYQAETGLSYNYFRDYDPQTGRYLESDPVGLEGGSYSTYAYSADDPVDLSDPLGLWVKTCSRWLGKAKNPSTGRWNPIRHDYLDVSGQFIGFYSAPGANAAWGRGVVAGQNEQDGGRCSMLCSDNKFDAYVLAAAQEIGAPTYCLIASIEFGLEGLAAEAAGARNCQSWARDVIAKAKKNYLAHEHCPTCFK